MRNIKILLTGATGYIGSNLAKHLIDQKYKVHIIVRQVSKFDLIYDIKDRLSIHMFSGETTELDRIVAEIKPDIVIHLAALFISEHKMEDVKSLINSNVLYGTQLLEAAVKNDVKYFINTGTHWQDFNGESYNPVNLYAATKKAFEDIAKYYVETSNMRLLTVKLIDTYGPFDPRRKVMTLFKQIADTKEPLKMSLGEQELGLVYIDEVVKGFMLAIKHITDLQMDKIDTCMIAPNEICTLKEAADIFEEVSEKRLNIIWGGREYRNREVMKITQKHFNILQKEHRLSLRDGIATMLNIEKIKS